MKNISLLFIALFTSFMVQGQSETQEFTIPLTDPGKPGKLMVDIQNGNIKVEGHTGKDVLVKIKAHPGGDYKSKSSRGREGLRRIPNNALSFEISEANNRVMIDGNRNRRTDFHIMVPRQFTLILETHHNGDVYVSDVSGEIEVNSHHGEIGMEGISGSVIADTHHGEIRAKFDAVTAGQPMAFSTYHGDVDITFPNNVDGKTKIKTERGDIYTDFEMEMKIQRKEESEDGVKKYFGGWLYGNLGKGGPEFMFNTYHGDVILRKK